VVVNYAVTVFYKFSYHFCFLAYTYLLRVYVDKVQIVKLLNRGTVVLDLNSRNIHNLSWIK
jgi:hypothetical protein